MKKLNLFLGLLVFAVVASFSMALATTTYTSTQGASYNLHQPLHNGEAAMVSVSYEAVALAATDVLQLVKVPKNVTVTDVILYCDDLDSGGSAAIVIDVGYGDNVDYFIDGATTCQAGGIGRTTATTALPLAFTADDTIDAVVVVSPTTGAAGTISLTVFYTKNP